MKTLILRTQKFNKTVRHIPCAHSSTAFRFSIELRWLFMSLIAEHTCVVVICDDHYLFVFGPFGMECAGFVNAFVGVCAEEVALCLRQVGGQSITAI